MKQAGKSTDGGDQRQPHSKNGSKLNWLRASVLGANDGIVSIAGLVVGVAGASSSRSVIIASGVAGIVAGALSMAAGEYVSVSSQRDTERALLDSERHALDHYPNEELEELTTILERKGLQRETAELVALELTNKDAYAAHVDLELGLDPDNLTNPTHAAIASALAFLSGALIPLLAVTLTPVSIRVPFTFVSVILALVATGAISAHYGGADKTRAVMRVVLGGVLAMIVTYGIGRVVGVSGI